MLLSEQTVREPKYLAHARTDWPGNEHILSRYVRTSKGVRWGARTLSAHVPWRAASKYGQKRVQQETAEVHYISPSLYQF